METYIILNGFGDRAVKPPVAGPSTGSGFHQTTSILFRKTPALITIDKIFPSFKDVSIRTEAVLLLGAVKFLVTTMTTKCRQSRDMV